MRIEFTRILELNIALICPLFHSVCLWEQTEHTVEGLTL